MNLLLLLLLPSAAAATPTLRVEVDAAAPLDVPALAAALGEELDTTVVLDGDAPARVVVRAEGGGTITVVYEADDGARRERLVDLPREPEESARTVVLIASNLARDQVGAFDPREAAPVEAPVVVEPVVAEPVVVEPVPVETVGAAPVGSVATVTRRREPDDRRFHFGTNMIFGALPESSERDLLMLVGFETGARITRNFGFGVTRASFLDLGYASDGAGVLRLNGTPYAQLSGWLGERVEPFGRVGVAIRGVEARDEKTDPWFEAAPYAGGGLRYYPARYLGVGFELGANVVASETFTLYGDAMPRWTVLPTTAVTTTLTF